MLTHKVSFDNEANPRKPFNPYAGPKPSPSLQSGNSNQNFPKTKLKVTISYLSLFAMIPNSQVILSLIVLF